MSLKNKRHRIDVRSYFEKNVATLLTKLKQVKRKVKYVYIYPYNKVTESL